MTEKSQLVSKNISVERLVADGRRGRIRIPSFQRPLNWGKEDVENLFDSIHRSYPIGTLLLQEREAPVEHLNIAHVSVRAAPMANALYVVDGQQRLTSLIAALTPPDDGQRVAPYSVHYNWEDESFRVRSDESVERPWMRLDWLLDATELSMRLTEAPFDTLSSDEKRSLFEAGRRLREYQVPQYVLSTHDEADIQRIFFRVNTAGKAMKWEDVHHALFADPHNEPSTPKGVAESVSQLGMGTPRASDLQAIMNAVVGLDPAGKMAEYAERFPDKLRESGPLAARGLSRALAFLRDDVGVPHIRLVPHWASTMPVLARFFVLHPEPSERSRIRLRRWLWRGGFRESTERRSLLRAVVREEGSEDDYLQKLMRMLPDPTPWILGEKFDARSANSRELMLALSMLNPLTLTGAPIDLTTVINERDLDAFSYLVDGVGSAPENRVLALDAACSDWAAASNEVLGSHCLTREIAVALETSPSAALSERRLLLEERVRQIFNQRAEWDQTDRPSIQTLLRLGASDG